MKQDRRSPYLVLAVPYGTDARAASTAFAQRSKRARRDPDFPYGIDDLTWALHQIEHSTAEAASDLSTFRVPADPGALETPSEESPRLSPVRMARRTHAPTDDDWRALEAYAKAEAFGELMARSARGVAERYQLGDGSALAEQPVFVPAERRPTLSTGTHRPDGPRSPEVQRPRTATATAVTETVAPAGWYVDPADRFELRYWDGSKWTEHVVAQGTRHTDPPVKTQEPAVAVLETQDAVAGAGWYVDPASRFELRYWDGSKWTEHVSTGGRQFEDQPVA